MSRHVQEFRGLTPSIAVRFSESIHARREQRGETLIEMLFTIFLMGTVVLSLIGLLLTVVTSSAVHRATVSAGNQATTVAEAIDRLAYKPCGPSTNPKTFYSTAASIAEPEYTAEILSVKYLASKTSASPTFDSACPGGDKDQGAQLITIQVKLNKPPSSKATVELIKRNQTCPATGMAGQLQPNQLC